MPAAGGFSGRPLRSKQATFALGWAQKTHHQAPNHPKILAGGTVWALPSRSVPFTHRCCNLGKRTPTPARLGRQLFCWVLLFLHHHLFPLSLPPSTGLFWFPSGDGCFHPTFPCRPPPRNPQSIGTALSPLMLPSKAVPPSSPPPMTKTKRLRSLVTTARRRCPHVSPRSEQQNRWPNRVWRALPTSLGTPQGGSQWLARDWPESDMGGISRNHDAGTHHTTPPNRQKHSRAPGQARPSKRRESSFAPGGLCVGGRGGEGGGGGGGGGAN